jgi:hypothetical protein
MHRPDLPVDLLMPTHEEAHRELAALEARIHRAMGQEGAIEQFNRRAREHAHIDHATHHPSDYRPLDRFVWKEGDMTEVIVKGMTKRTPKAAKPKAQPHPCECGCGDLTKTGKARFIPGHDAKLKSALIRAALEGDRVATQRLSKLGWGDHLRKGREVQGRKKVKRADNGKVDSAKTE